MSLEKEENRKIGILGGTFDPPHLGHLYLCEKAREEFKLDEIWLLPSGTPPHKRNFAGKDERKAMLELLCEGRPYLSVCAIELEREGYTYTVDTLKELRRMLHENDRMYYIIGTDTLFQLETWKDHENVLRQTEFICVKRPGDDMRLVKEKIEEFARLYGKRIYLSRHTGPDISSTAIREAARKKEPVAGMLPKSIETYMERHNVYGF